MTGVIVSNLIMTRQVPQLIPSFPLVEDETTAHFLAIKKLNHSLRV